MFGLLLVASSVASLVVKNPPVNAGDAGSLLGLRRSLGEGNGNRLQYPCLVNPMDKGAGWANLSRVAKRVGHNSVTKQQQGFVEFLFKDRSSLVSALNLCYGFIFRYDSCSRSVTFWGSQLNAQGLGEVSSLCLHQSFNVFSTIQLPVSAVSFQPCSSCSLQDFLESCPAKSQPSLQPRTYGESHTEFWNTHIWSSLLPSSLKKSKDFYSLEFWSLPFQLSKSANPLQLVFFFFKHLEYAPNRKHGGSPYMFLFSQVS